MIHSSSGTSRAATILAELEAKRREPINAAIEKQRLSVRTELLAGIEEERDLYLEKGNKILAQLGKAETELDALRSETLNFMVNARKELKNSKHQIDENVKSINNEINRLVERASRLRNLNNKEEEAYVRQIEREKTRLKLQESLAKQKTTIRDIAEKMKSSRTQDNKLPSVLRDEAVKTYREYRATEEALDKLEKQSDNSPAALIAMIDQRIKEMREAHDLSVKSSSEATKKLNELLTQKTEFEISTAKRRDEINQATLNEMVARGLKEFLFEEEDEDEEL